MVKKSTPQKKFSDKVTLFREDFSEVLKKTPKLKTVLFILLIFFVANILIHLISVLKSFYWNQKLPFWEALSEFIKELGNVLGSAVASSFNVFFEHSWIEIFCAILVYVLLEARIKNLFDVPENVGPRNHGEILKNLSNKEETHREIRILDTSIHSYIEDYLLFKSSLLMALQNNKKLRIEILLLHPDTYAAEQRGRDLSSKTRNMLFLMKKGIGNLFKCIEEIKNQIQDADIKVKLFKATPIMIYTSWDYKANFGLLPSNDYADIKDTFLIYLRTDLGLAFTTYFNELWGNEKNTTLLEDYLFLKISVETNLYDKIYWGGTNEDRETPRYISCSKNSLEIIYEKKLPITIIHDKKNKRAILKSKLKSQEGNEYIFAQQQINNTHGRMIEEIDDHTIYELEYLYEKFQLKLNDINFVNSKLEEDIHCFVSHKQYDVNFNITVQTFVQNFVYCLDKFSNTDLAEVKAIEEIRNKLADKDQEYSNNPRKRLFLNFNCSLQKGIIDVKPNEQNCTYKAPFSIQYLNERSTEVQERDFVTPFKLKKELEPNGENYKQDLHALTVLIKFIKSVIRADLLYLLGENKFSQTFQKYSVDVNLLRTEVGTKISGTASPTPQHYQYSKSDYKVIHLIQRENITGGVNHLKYDNPAINYKNDFLLLEKPLDSVFFKNKISFNNQYVTVLHHTTDIELKTGAEKGKRDVLVIEFYKV